MPDVRQAVTIDDLKQLARKRSPGFVWMPMETGSGDGLGPRRNVEAFDRYRLNARAMVDCSASPQDAVLFGRRYAVPFGISALGYAGNLRLHADQMFAEAAVEADIPFILSGGSCAPIEEIARIAPGRLWQQLYIARDPAVTDDIVRRGRDCGVEVLVVTIDGHVPIHNHWIARKGLRLPVHVPMRTWPYVLWEAATHPGWSWDVVRNGGLPGLESFAAYAPPGANASEITRVAASQFPSFQTWGAIERLRALWPGKLVVKGVMDPRDATLALNAGADAVTVSNHGGNKFDQMPASLDVLEEIVRGVEGRAPVLFDGGVRRGSDIVTALGLGADFTMIGRAALYGVMAAGVPGVLRAVEILRDEARRTRIMMGCDEITDLRDGMVRKHGCRLVA